ncbi:Adenylate cyclase type 10 [Hondaea fermentalgiana]|uniref:Adenylate cyclase type 10 n=1 Tax=Hondaea fermentalgiana TaxID=2315210 RepID=A0A2R5G639_9STRA|nr:Adenylate cyclase type 10 [Hondaea fermentalgiana]|eukprot:GBG26506.1 Adenylate cyclase type 10 [Hondaea fermentalgiana]
MPESKVQDDDCESIAQRERFASNEEKKDDNDDNDDHEERKISDSIRDSLEGKQAHADSSPISVPELGLGAMYHDNKSEKECQDDSTDDGDRFFSMSASKDPNSYDPAEDEDAFISSSARKSTKLSLPRFFVGSFMARSTSELLTFLEENGNVTLTSQTSHALVMLADISGFTALSENLCSRGPEGVDELSEIISDFLGALIKIVKAYGGDIVAFAGDALIITWVTRPSDLVYQTLRVFQCGLELASLTRPQLTLHIGIASGKTHFTIIGGTDGSWNWLVIGEAIVRMGDAEGHASSKEVVVTEETYAPVKEFCNVETIVEEREDSPNMIGSFHRKRGLVKLIGVNMPEELESKADISLVGGNMILSQMSTKFKVTSTSAEAQDNALTAAYTSALSFVDKLRCFIPGPAIEVLRAGERYLNEYRKRICVLFIMLDGFSVDIYDPDSDGKTLAKLFHETLRDLQQVLFSYNGLLRQFLVDDKGCVFIACFGVAGHTHRDDPTRALACGLNMGRILESRKIRSYIGLSTGAAFCGAVGSTDRREYAMVGRDVNLAARLMSLSRKRALQEERFSMLICNEETYTETKTEPQVEFTALEPVRLKGYENLVQTYLCENRDDDAARRELSFDDSSALAELVGRRDVKEKVAQVASSLVPGKPQVVTICGEQGMGKTLVAIHLKAFLEKRGFQSISCKVFSASQSTPYAVFQQIFWQLLGLDPRADVDIVEHLGTSKLSKEDLDERRKRLFNDLMLRVDEYEQALNSSTPRRSSLTHHKSLDVFPSQAMVMRCLGRILRVLLRGYRSEGHKLVIFVDDVHYADSLSGKAISELLQSAPGQLLLVFTRQVAMTTAPITQAQGWYKNLCDVVKVTNLNLMPLGRDESLRVIKTAAGDSNLKSNAIDFIIDQGQGNPGRCEEITKSLALSEETELVENTAINVVLERAVQAKFDQLPDTHRALLKTAAVIGFCFPVACLRDIVPRSISRKGDHILAEVIEDLETNDWLESTEGPYGELMYAFRTRLAKDICYNLNTSRNLKMLHLSVAQYYQKTYDEDLRPYFVLLSHHYRRAHNDTMALKFMMYSFRTNIAIGALPEAYAVIEAIPDLNLGAPKLLPALMEMKELVGDDSYFSDGQELAVSQAASDGTGFGPSASSPQTAEGMILPNDGALDATHSSMERYTSSAMMSKIEAVRKYVILNRSGDEYEGSSNPTQSVITEPNESVVPMAIDEANTESGPAPSRACAIL